MTNSEPILDINNLTCSFGTLVAVDNVSLTVSQDEILSVIGPNGAGKTTFFNLITGKLTPDEGSISYREKEITGLRDYEIVREGLARSFQISNIFPQLTVRENLQVGVQKEGQWYNFWRHRSSFKEWTTRVEELAALVNLSDYLEITAADLSHADQRLLEIGLTLATSPEVILLDEPTAGLSLEETNDIMEVLAEKVFSEVEALIMIEHDMDVVKSHSDRVVVLNNGGVLMEGSPMEVQQDEQVKNVYLGEV